jgi:hypothetical protein
VGKHRFAEKLADHPYSRAGGFSQADRDARAPLGETSAFQEIVENMKTKLLLFAMSAFSLSGCSFFVARSGKDVGELTTREQVLKEFGKPTSSSTEDDKEFDEFRYHGKVANEPKADEYRAAFALTLGLGEFFIFPLSVFETGRDFVAGQEIRFYYDQNGRTSECLVNGEHPYVDDPFVRKPHE